MNIVLASTSPYRAALLTQLGLRFEQRAPSVDETPKDNEAADALALRLAQEKSLAVVKAHSGSLSSPSLVIGSDQVATCDGKLLGKPGTVEKAYSQLAFCSGKTVCFFTGLCISSTKDNTSKSLVEEYQVKFRQLTKAQIMRYVDKELPLNCAGSFKSEGLGISLFEQFEGRDPNTLIGLPLMALVSLLSEFGVDVLTHYD